MAVGTPVLLGTNFAVNSGADLGVTLSRDITTDAMAFAVVFIGKLDSVNPVAPTGVSGGGVTWTLDKTGAYDTGGASRATIFVYRALASAPSGTAVTVDFADTPEGTCVAVFEVEGCDTGGTNGADAIHATNIGIATGTTNLIEVAVSTLSSAGNAFLAIAGNASTGDRSWSPDASPTMEELADFSHGLSAGSKYRRLGIFYGLGVADSNPTIGATASSSVDANGIYVLELVEAPVGPTISTQPSAATAIVAPSEPAVFTVETADAMTGVEWQDDGTEITGADIALDTDLNAGTSELTVTPTATTRTGSAITAECTDASGMTESNAATLTVRAGVTETQVSETTDGDGEVAGTLATDVQGDALEKRIAFVAIKVNGTELVGPGMWLVGLAP